jgi:hypothetical protein
MDAITTIILTAIVTALANAIVVGILVHRIQKKFEVTIQESLFEHQTKFARNHPRTLEVMETLNQKLSVYSKGFLKMVYEVESFLESGTLNIGIDDFKKNNQQLDELLESFEQSKLFLPSRLDSELENIISLRTMTLHGLLPYVLPFFRIDNNEFSLHFLIENRIIKKMFDSEISQIDLEKPDVNLLLGEMTHAMIGQCLKLEKLYKSVADIKG